MNLILFTEFELREGVPMHDPRAQHILRTLRRSPGETFDIGIIDGRRGKASIVSQRTGSLLRFEYELGEESPPLYPVTLLVGMSRPQIMRRILRDCTSLGVSRFHFFASDRGEAAYSNSTLWKSGECRRHLIDGAQQAFSTRLPEVVRSPSLAEALAGEHIGTGGLVLRVALDNYESKSSLGIHLREWSRASRERAGERVPSTVVIGSERGWSAEERICLRSRAIPLVHLGERVLRTDVACLAALGILLSGLGWYD